MLFLDSAAYSKDNGFNYVATVAAITVVTVSVGIVAGLCLIVTTILTCKYRKYRTGLKSM